MNTINASVIGKALARRHEGDFFLTEVKSGSTYHGTANRILDAVALKKSWAHPRITGYEIKVSRSDFLRDEKYVSYLPLVHELYIATPAKLITKEEVPPEVGLIWYDHEKNKLSVVRRPPLRQIQMSADFLLYIIYSRIDGDRYPFYSNKAAYYKAWVENKRSNAELGYNVKNKMLREIQRLEFVAHDANAAADRATRRNENAREELDELKKVMYNYGMQPYIDSRNSPKWLNEALERPYAKEFDDVADALNRALRTIEKLKGDGQ
jgi:predicted nucleic acid-binding protein